MQTCISNKAIQMQTFISDKSIQITEDNVICQYTVSSLSMNTLHHFASSKTHFHFKIKKEETYLFLIIKKLHQNRPMHINKIMKKSLERK